MNYKGNEIECLECGNSYDRKLDVIEVGEIAVNVICWKCGNVFREEI